MGQAIHYCFRCSTQLRDSHFEQGKAYRIDSRVCCAECAPEAVRSLPSDRVQILLSQIAAKDQRPAVTPATPRAATPRQGSTVSTHRRAPERVSRPPWLLIGIVAGVTIVVIGAVLVFSGGSEAPTDVHPPEKPAVKAPTPALPDSPGRLALKKAKEYARAHPGDLFGQLREVEDLTLLEDKTEAGVEARQAAESLRVRGKEAVARGLATLDGEIAGPVGREEFGAASDLLEAARSRQGWPEWKLALDERVRTLQDREEKLYAPLKAKAGEAKSRGDAAELKSIVDRVQRWGVGRLSRDLDESLAEVSLPPVRVRIQDFEKEFSRWGYVGGQEFPGAKGSMIADATSSHAGARSCRLEGDFSGGGAYVGIWCDLTSLPDRDFKEIRLWVKTATVGKIGVRLADSTDQIHQKNGGVAIARTTAWQEVVLRIQDMVGGERWGGANDGKWHGPAKGFGINISKECFLNGDKQGILWIDDVEGLHVPAPR